MILALVYKRQLPGSGLLALVYKRQLPGSGPLWPWDILV